MRKVATARVLGALILALSLPTFLSLLWHRLSGDPTMRPLGITKEALQDESGEGLIIQAHVNWGTIEQSAASQQELARALIRGFSAKGVVVEVQSFSSQAPNPTVTYQVGPSTIGPFPAFSAAQGINAAVEAYRMNVPFIAQE
ncbi:hypothetical protein O2N63_13310 [Aliiroseovarius sp. KMU-50]|uniref:Uncharacterized protein n=1 Tax=Aliiroseovarius salicola TaxID=3009082 RepID=A0ABT4W3H3_9RHOB|nr:hypothetical protein [Aliiroseovarius sp. KMU-50]MDA5095062.1 hypothetical protein [Aliiroseovarius sp. KMU-50]